jgi:hypothetical protein
MNRALGTRCRMRIIDPPAGRSGVKKRRRRCDEPGQPRPGSASPKRTVIPDEAVVSKSDPRYYELTQVRSSAALPRPDVMKKPTPPRIEKLPAAKQRSLDALLDKNSEGTITPKEKERLEQLVAEAERLMVANAKRLAKFARGGGKRTAPSGVPVTVWVQREPAGR